MKHILILLFAIFSFSAVHADGPKPKIVKAKTLEASLIVTDHGPEMYAEWEKNPSVFPVWHIDKLQRTVKNVLIILVTDCTPDKNGNCSLLVSYKNFKPDGSLYGQYLNRYIQPFRGSGKEMPPYLSKSYMMLTIEPADPAGEYSLQAFVADQISHESIHLEEHAVVQ